MKRYLKTAMITSIVMLFLLGGATVFLMKSAKTVQKEQEKLVERQLDKKVYGVEQEDVSDDKIIPLYLDGENKNVTTFTYESVKAIYNKENSKRTAKELERLKKKNSYNMDNPLWSYNPFGTNELSLYLYFQTVDAYSVEYTVHIKDGETADFNRACPGVSGKKEHEYQIVGLVPGKENFIILKFYDAQGELKNRKVYSVTLPEIKGVNSHLMEIDGKSLEQISQGLYFFLGHDWENKKAPRGIWIYDNSGVLRGAVPTVSGRVLEILELGNELFYNYSMSGLCTVNRLGQVTETYNLESHRLSGDFAYDGHGHIVLLTTKKNAKTTGDRILTLDMKTGKFGKEISLTSIIKGASKKKNWLKADSLVMMGSNGVLINAAKLSSLIRIQNIFSENPTLAYVIGPEKVWKKADVTRLSYADEEATAEPFKPTGLRLVDDSLAADRTFRVAFYNNNKAGKSSSLAEYTINESDGTYYLESSFELPESVRENSVQAYRGHWIVNSAEDCSVSEYDEKGKAILTFKYHISNYTPKVYKKDMKGFWFQ
ncbi:MAG: aryl-sulfate sulfotransferase [Acetivibrio ethanolgignens]